MESLEAQLYEAAGCYGATPHSRPNLLGKTKRSQHQEDESKAMARHSDYKTDGFGAE
jgi:hypothetical protein